MVTLAPVLNWPFPSPSDQTRTTHPGTGKEGKSRCSMSNAHTGLCTSILVQSPFYHSSFTPPLRAFFFCDSEKYFQTLGANIVELCDELKSSPLTHPPTPIYPHETSSTILSFPGAWPPGSSAPLGEQICQHVSHD